MSFRKKFIFTFLIIVFFCFFLFLTLFSFQFSHNIKDKVIKRDRGFVKNLKEELSYLIFLENWEAIDVKVDTLKDLEQVAYIYILNKNNDIIISSFEEKIPKGILNSNPLPKGSLFIDRLITYNSSKIRDFAFRVKDTEKNYIIHIGIDEGFIHKEVKPTVIMTASILLICLILGGMAFYLIFSRLNKSFENLLKGMEQIERGDFNVRIEEKGDRETLTLIKAYNKMADAIEEKDNKLRYSYEKTEHFNTLLKVIHNISQLVKEHINKKDLITQVCKDLIDTKEIFFVWIALFNEEGHALSVEAAGINKDDLLYIEKIFKSGKLYGLCKSAYNESGIKGSDQVQSTCSDCPLCTRCQRQDAGILALRLEYKEKIYGIMVAAIPFQYTNEEEERYLFQEIGNDIAYALYGIELAEEKRRVEDEMIRQGERLQAVFEAVPDPIIIYNSNGLVEYINPAFSELFGWTLEELQGKGIPYVPEKEKGGIEGLTKELYKTGRPFRIETVRLRKDGSEVPVLLSASIIRSKDGNPAGVIVSLRDLSEKIEMERQFQRAQRMEALGNLAGGIAHDFNNLLMGIQGNISLLLFDIEKREYDKIKGRIRNVERLIRDGSELTRQLLGFARGGKYEVKVLNVNKIVKEQVQLFARTRKDIMIHERYQKELWPIEADRGQIIQIIMNLLVNASQAMPGGGDLFVATENVEFYEDKIRPFEIKKGSYIKISITDTGFGMDEATKERIFEPFFTTKPRGMGTGLGLAAVYGIVKNHGGYINVQSEKGKGSTFEIYLPGIVEKDKAESKPDDEKFAYLGILKGTGTIFLIDDEEIILSTGKEMLEGIGYNVITASEGKEAIKIFKDRWKDIDLVILDIIMPGMSGRRVFEELKKINPEVKVLLSSGYSIDEKTRDLLKKEGCKGFIQKPFSIEKLSIKIKEILISS